MEAHLECPYLRSCKQESEDPIHGKVTGTIPDWLQGSLVRVGAGLLEVGPDKYNSVFDGLALLHRFGFRKGNVTYQNRFLRSDTYQSNMRANRIVVAEFGTQRVPDPCKTIFQRLTSLFSSEMTDNDLVNIVMYGEDTYACTETNFIWKVDSKTLESLEKVNLSRLVPVDTATAHAHVDRDGTVYNVGIAQGLTPNYCIHKFPPKAAEKGGGLQEGSVVSRIPSSRFLQSSYHHSFGMSDNFFVFIEQPLFLSLPRLAWAHFVAGTYADAISSNQSPTRFYVVRRSDGSVLPTPFLAPTFFLFHHVNAYEEEGHLVVDVVAYEDANMLRILYVDALKEYYEGKSSNGSPTIVAEARRYVIPLDVEGKEPDVNLVKLAKSESTALLQPDGNVLLKHELLHNTDDWHPELPRINYEMCNGRKYRYFYALARKEFKSRTYLVKVDTWNKTSVTWLEEGAIPSEPVFVAAPDTGKNMEEDTGVIVASLLHTDDDHKVSLLILDARTFQEVGRADFIAKGSVPADFHGTFVSSNTS